MVRAEDAYSRLVAWLKILLPIAALAILSTLFLLSHSIDPMQAVPYADVDIADLMREPRITAPNYAGVTGDGTAIQISAETARPDPAHPARVAASVLKAEIETPDGVATRISADHGGIDGDAGQVTLQGSVLMTNSLGYRITAASLSLGLDQTSLRADAGIAADGPFGRITAGQMVLNRSAGGTYVLVFNGGVKLLYDPAQ